MTIEDKQLQQLLAQNKENIEAFEPQEGDFDRFMAKYEARQGVLKQSRKARRLWMRIAIPIAAALAVFAGLYNFFDDKPQLVEDQEYFSDANSCKDIYTQYMMFIAKSINNYSQQIAVNDNQLFEDYLNTMQQMTFESVTLMEQLPDELDEETKRQYMIDYYSDMIDGVQMINNYYYKK